MKTDELRRGTRRPRRRPAGSRRRVRPGDAPGPPRPRAQSRRGARGRRVRDRGHRVRGEPPVEPRAHRRAQPADSTGYQRRRSLVESRARALQRRTRCDCRWPDLRRGLGGRWIGAHRRARGRRDLDERGSCRPVRTGRFGERPGRRGRHARRGGPVRPQPERAATGCVALDRRRPDLAQRAGRGAGVGQPRSNDESRRSVERCLLRDRHPTREPRQQLPDLRLEVDRRHRLPADAGTDRVRDRFGPRRRARGDRRRHVGQRHGLEGHRLRVVTDFDRGRGPRHQREGLRGGGQRRRLCSRRIDRRSPGRFRELAERCDLVERRRHHVVARRDLHAERRALPAGRVRKRCAHGRRLDRDRLATSTGH